MWRFYDSGGRQKFNTDPAIPLVTSLPSSPNDGDECLFTDSLTAGTYHWHLRYVSARASNKWVFIGGSSGYSFVATSESTTSTSYVALTTAGPSFALPVAGDYIVEIGMRGTSPGAGGKDVMSYDIGGTGAVDADSIQSQNPIQEVFGTRKKTGLTAVTLTAKYKSSAAGTSTFENRSMRVTPIAVGG